MINYSYISDVMDFSKFLDEDFNVNTWVNNAFKAHQDDVGAVAQNKRDVYAATLVTKLQVFIQEVNKSLEEMSVQVVNSMPRVLRDVEALKQEASYLKQQMQQVKEDIHDVEKKTSNTMKVLVLTDQVRSRVERSCSALKEADNWSSLAAAIEDVFRSGDSYTIAVRLKSMQNSLEILKDSPDYDDKVMHLEALKNRLESQVSPQAVAAFMQHNTEDAKKLQKIFSTIGRESELHKYYVKTYSSNLTNQWQEIISNEDDKSNIVIMKELFDLLLSTWHGQLPWCRTVFGSMNATIIILKLLVQLMALTKPGFIDVITSALEAADGPKLQPLLELHGIAKQFAINLEESVETSCGFPMSHKIDKKLSENLADALWMPFAEFQINYKELENEVLMTKLSEVVMDAGDLMDLTQVLSTSADKVFVIATEAVKQCDKLTGYLGSQDLIIPLNTFFHSYTDKFSRALRTVILQYGLNKKDSGDLEISEDHYYSLFQHSLRIITTCGKLLQSFSDFEQKLMSNILGSKCAEIALAGLLEFEQTDEASVVASKQESTWVLYNYMKRVDEKEYRKLQDMLVSLKQSPPSQRSLLPTVKQSLMHLNQQSHQLAFDIAFAQIRKQLALIPQLEIWSNVNTPAELVDNSELPAFSLPPTEYATTIGQYLMTLPQHLEPLAAGLSEGDGELSAMETALHTAKLPFSLEDEKSDVNNMADRWLTSIVRASEHTYVEACLQIPSLTIHTARQLAADLDYMGNVVDSLGLPVFKDIALLIKLLRSSESEFESVSTDIPKRLVSSIARIRNIKENS
ncbi:conserved oligomeric Golgi complex subunit 7-like [Styela clava]